MSENSLREYFTLKQEINLCRVFGQVDPIYLRNQVKKIEKEFPEFKKAWDGANDQEIDRIIQGQDIGKGENVAENRSPGLLDLNPDNFQPNYELVEEQKRLAEETRKEYELQEMKKENRRRVRSGKIIRCYYCRSVVEKVPGSRDCQSCGREIF